MIIEFKTKRNQYGHREYIRIDTDKKTFTRMPSFIPEGIEVKMNDYRELVEKCRNDNFTEV